MRPGASNERVYRVSFASVYPHYVTKVENPGSAAGRAARRRSDVIIHWLTGFPLRSLSRNAVLIGLVLRQLPSLAQQNVEADQYLADLGPGDTLFMKAHIADCGEFGGHSELIRLFRNNEGRMMADYRRDTVICREAYREGFPLTREPVERKEVVLDEEMMKTVNGFIRSLIARAGRNEGDRNASNDYRVSRPSLKLRVDYSNRDMDWSGFFDMKRRLFPGAREINWHR